MTNSTIAALTTAPYPSGVAVIRISGNKAKETLEFITDEKNVSSKIRNLTLSNIINPQTKEILDSALVVFMKAPNSFTGEDCAEIQFHGSPLIAKKILNVLYENGVEPAEPGEFSKRAFINNKIDLSQAEAICDLISATNDRALKLAQENLSGKLSSILTQIGEPVRDVLAEIEASIDFPEEEINPDTLSKIKENIYQASQKISNLIDSFEYGAILRDGYRVLLCGKPNVGKSSILNLLLGKDRAIVSDISGTTRDLIEESMDLNGYKVVLCDTAGIRESNDKIEQIGVKLAKNRFDWADLILYVVDANNPDSYEENFLEDLNSHSSNVSVLVNKIDLSVKLSTNKIANSLKLSCSTKEGLNDLLTFIIGKIEDSQKIFSESNHILTNERHKNCLNNSQAALKEAIIAIDKSLPLEIISSEIRIALTALNEIIGKTYTEDILGRIFSKFCIGK